MDASALDALTLMYATSSPILSAIGHHLRVEALPLTAGVFLGVLRRVEGQPQPRLLDRQEPRDSQFQPPPGAAGEDAVTYVDAVVLVQIGFDQLPVAEDVFPPFAGFRGAAAFRFVPVGEACFWVVLAATCRVWVAVRRWALLAFGAFPPDVQ